MRRFAASSSFLASSSSRRGWITSTQVLLQESIGHGGSSRLDEELEKERIARIEALKSMPQLPQLTNFMYGKVATTWKAPGAMEMNDVLRAAVYGAQANTTNFSASNGTGAGNAAPGGQQQQCTPGSGPGCPAGATRSGSNQFTASLMLITSVMLTYLTGKLLYRRFFGSSESVPLWLASSEQQVRYFLYITGTDAATRKMCDDEYLRTRSSYPGLSFFDWLAARYPQHVGSGRKYSYPEAVNRVATALQHDGSFMASQLSGRTVAYAINTATRATTVPPSDRVDMFVDLVSNATPPSSMFGFGTAPPPYQLTSAAAPVSTPMFSPGALHGGGAMRHAPIPPPMYIPPPHLQQFPMPVHDPNFSLDNNQGLAPQYSMSDVLNTTQSAGMHGSNPFAPPPQQTMSSSQSS